MGSRLKHIYKYRSYNNIEYVLDIFENHRLYFPRKDELNDPLEGLCQPLYFTYMGIDYYADNGLEQPESKQFFNQFRILSFSKFWNNMQMWAHYALNYNGICIDFNVDDSFKDLREVQYTNRRYRPIVRAGLDEIDNQLERTIVNRNFFTKSKNWKYEGEYRIVRKQEKEYLEFKKESVSSVIFGNLSIIDRDYVEKTYEQCSKQGIPLYYVQPNLEYYGLSKRAFNIQDYRRGLCNPRNILITNYSSGETAIMHHLDDGTIMLYPDSPE